MMLPRLRRIHILFRFRLSFLYLALLGLAGQARCRPTHIPRDSHNGLGRPLADQNLFQEPEVVRVAQNILLQGNIVRECCALTLTPITLPSGQPAVVLVRSCILEDKSDPAGACGVNATYTGSNPTTGTTSTITTSSSMNAPITLSFTSVPAFTTTNHPQSTSTLASSFDPSSSSSSTPTPTASTPNLTSSSSPSTALPEESSTFTSTTTLPATTSPVNNAVSSTPQQSSTLPKVLGGLAGAAVLLLVVAGTIGYMKQKKMARGEEPIRWPVTS